MFYSLIIIFVCFVVKTLTSTIPSNTESFLVDPKYLTNEELRLFFQDLTLKYPSLAKLHYLGKSVNNETILAFEISKNVGNRSIGIPMFKYVANMHGDETLGRQLLIFLSQYLLENYGVSERISKLVDTVDIFLMPSLNPDGFAASVEGNCDSLHDFVGRSNAHNVDLNRDFPDQFKNIVIEDTMVQSRQPETLAMMTWIANNPFVLSGNLHGGALVASYPYDDSSTGRDCCVESLAPDDRVFRSLAETYASLHPEMHKGDTCPPDHFKNGITNGAMWYEVRGGMQDYNYVHSNCFDVTFELSCCKYPNASLLPVEWQNNKESLISFIEAVHWGVKGSVVDKFGEGIPHAQVIVEGNEKIIYTTDRGEYWRLLTPATYNISAHALGYNSSPIKAVTVTRGKTVNLDFELSESSHSSGRLPVTVTKNITDEYGFIQPVKFEHHNYSRMVDLLNIIANEYPRITRLYSIGKSVQNRDLYVLEITDNPGVHEPGEPEFKYIANMHGNEVVGREVLLLLVQYLCQNYNTNSRVTSIINNTRLHFLITMNPDGYEISTEGDATSVVGRANANNFDLNRNFPDQYTLTENNRTPQPETISVIKWIHSFPFVLSANLHGGALVANYPYDDNPDQKTGETNMSPDNDIFVSLAKSFSDVHPTMHLGRPCPGYPKEHFPGGIVNGAEWYVVPGGMQDYNYITSNCMELTLELGCFKFPYKSELPKYWMDNRESLLTYIEQIHRGVHGFIRSTEGNPIANASILVEGINHKITSAKDGDYWRLLVPGVYNIIISHPGYATLSQTVTVPEGTQGISVNFTLLRHDSRTWAINHDFGLVDNIRPIDRYLDYSQVVQQLAYLDSSQPSLAMFTDVMNLSSVTVMEQAGSPRENKFQIAVVGGLFATEPAGQEMSIRLANHLVRGYESKDQEIMNLLKSAVVEIVPSVDHRINFVEPIMQCQMMDPTLNLVASNLSLNSPSNEMAKSFISFLRNKQFDVIILLEGGGLSVVSPTEDVIINSIYEMAKQSYNKGNFENPVDCSSSTTYDVWKKSVLDSVKRISGSLVMSARLSCCNFEDANEIPNLWRSKLVPLMNLLTSVNQGVNGSIIDEDGNTLRETIIKVRGSSHEFKVTRNTAIFKIPLPVGNYQLQITCPHHEQMDVDVVVTDRKVTQIKVMLKKGSQEIFKTSPYKHTSGIIGFVTSTHSHPIVGAVVTAVRENVSVWTNDDGSLFLPVPPGEHTVEVTASGYLKLTKVVTVASKSTVQVIFRLLKEEKVLGLPRLAFIIISGIAGMMALGIGLCSYMACTDKPWKVDKSGFTLVPQKSSYFYDDGKDTELFHTPIRGTTIAATPYYDSSDNENYNSDSEAEIIMADLSKS